METIRYWWSDLIEISPAIYRSPGSNSPHISGKFQHHLNLYFPKFSVSLNYL